MEQWLQFAQEQWYVLLIGLVAVIVIINVVKALVKWLLIIAIVAGIAYYAIDYTDKIKDVGGQIMDLALEQALEAMSGDAGSAQYMSDADGNYMIIGENITIHGNISSEEVEIEFKGQKIKIRMNDIIREYVQKVKDNNNI